MHLPSSGVEIQNVTADFGTLMVSGPESRRVLGELAGDAEAWSKVGDRCCAFWGSKFWKYSYFGKFVI